ncbi:sugar-transfer associated ATP-grasp domain-containing protein [Pseudorhodoferax sp.]|uniref:sugar-transfer associated ATP-grasp domain-containing protein n=1 Tax=Pseudorhodoferax sp. TaxID=1993553 RepID=UPI002DD6277E|nr:sugar-transfer associated ATP-grasp domain-containing protein [Pseudorhodoferax sp.]
MALLYSLRRIGPGYFVDGAWWRPEIPFADKWKHVNRSEYRRLVERFNPSDYRKASQHKVVEKATLQLLALPTARCHGFLHRVRGRTVDGAPLCTAQDLTRLLARHAGSRVCFKPVEGYGGKGFQALDVRRADDGTLHLVHPLSGQSLTVDAWLAQHMEPDGYLLEEHLTQHPDLADINPSSLNTLRMWVFDDGQSISTKAAMLRVGRAGRQTDNTSGGGIPCPIDIESGRITFVVDIANAPDTEYLLSHHPDTGAPLGGRQIPHWQACRQLAAQALAAFPHMRLAGLDIAVTVDGPKVIELNAMPDYRGCAYMGLPLKRLRSVATPAEAAG